MLEKFFPSSLPLQPQDDLQQVACALAYCTHVLHLMIFKSFQLMAALETKIDSDGCSKKAKARHPTLAPPST